MKYTLTTEKGTFTYSKFWFKASFWIMFLLGLLLGKII